MTTAGDELGTSAGAVASHVNREASPAPELVGRGWLGTGGRRLSLADLAGKIVVLDFWTFCCVNCLHVLDELREIEREFADRLVVVGVHSPKFEHEKDAAALAAAVDRYGVAHPVLDDPELRTWTAYGAQAWPTLVVIDPLGQIVAQMAGEGHGAALRALVFDLIERHDRAGTLRPGDGPFVATEVPPSDLRFPSKAVALDDRLLVADAGQHCLTELFLDGDSWTVGRRFGAPGERGFVDGIGSAARFSEPHGLAVLPAGARESAGFDVLVADTVNHCLRGLRLADGLVTTVAGTGAQWMPGEPTDARLSSPWDVAWDARRSCAIVAMAGVHQLWTFQPAPAGTDGRPARGTVAPWLGTTDEGLVDGGREAAWFAQPSAVAVDGDEIWVVDAETSALRVVAADDRVRTVVGQGLFDFGHRDGIDRPLLQHPLGLCVRPHDVLVADTYNGAIRRYDRTTGVVTTVATGLAEPVDVLPVPAATGADLLDRGSSAGATPADAAPTSAASTSAASMSVSPAEADVVLVVESSAHAIRRIRLGPGEVVDGPVHRTARPVTTVRPGTVPLDVPFHLPPGQKLDTTYGPATRLRVSATPPELLVAGSGESTDLHRELVFADAATEGVLHISAFAASCDDEEYPACHVHQQDWGVPVRIGPDGEADLTLPLFG